KQRHPRASAARPGDPGENKASLLDLDVRGEPEHDNMDNLFGIHTLPIPPYLKEGNNSNDLLKTASICFITDAGNCSGREFSSSEDTDGKQNPDYKDPGQQCQDAGYKTGNCPELSHPVNFCPSDRNYYKQCVCDDGLVECKKPYYGVGASCGGKYKSCKLDNPRACKEDGYSQKGSCSSVQTPNKRCPYDSSYYDKCVCRSDLVTCRSPQVGNGASCGGKYASCCTPLASESGCNCYSCSDGCGGTRQCCGTCHTHSYSCPSGYQSSSCGSGYTQTGKTSKSCSCGATSGSCYKCSYNGSSGGGSSGGGNTGGGGSTPPANPWKVWREFLPDHRCYNESGNYCKKGQIVWVQDADLYCKNTSTGEMKYICKRTGYKASKCFDTASECNADPGAWNDHRIQTGSGYENISCNSDGTYNGCPW
ncbi:MAG: hypothetical protein Q4F75_07950, partial [Pseudomonadota bacterium]|nr:hypothetical protein [Pseudomonadota bacterium]